MVLRQLADRYECTPTHISGKADTLLAVESGTHQRTNTVASNHDIEYLALPAADLDGRTILGRFDTNAARVQSDVGPSQRAAQNIEQIGTVN